MSLTTVEYQDSFCQAVNAIVDGKISGIKYDFTDRCTIVDDSKASFGKYYVDNGKAKYYAYTENTKYKKGENVYVLIPQNDYTKDKTIIGKVISDNEEAQTGLSPLDDIAIFKTYDVQLYGERGILANDPDTFKKPIASFNIDISELCGFTMMGIELNISALFPYDFVTSGEYGIWIDFYNNQEQIGPGYRFSSIDFLGNPYNLNKFFTQKISNILNIDFLRYYNKNLEVQISLFQNQDFKYFDNVKDHFFPYEEIGPNGESHRLMDNIVVDNIKLHFGRSVLDFKDIDNGSILEIYPALAFGDTEKNNYSYEFIAKWFYKETNNEKIIYKLFDSLDSVDNYFGSNYKEESYFNIILWYIEDNTVADEGAGVNWKRIDGQNFTCSITSNINSSINIKCKLEKITEVLDLFNSVEYQSNILKCTGTTDGELTEFIFAEADNPNRTYLVGGEENQINNSGVTVSSGEAYIEGKDSEQKPAPKYETREIAFGEAKLRLSRNGVIEIWDPPTTASGKGVWRKL